MTSDVGVGLLQRIDETQGSLPGILAQVVGNGLVNIPVGLLARDDWPGFYPWVLALADLRTRSRRPSK